MSHPDDPHARALLRSMLLIRRFEERCAELYTQRKIHGFLHLYIGEEAVAVGSIAALEPRDSIVATYREHGQALAWGVSTNSVMAEMYGKQEGCARGRGGSMHIFDADTRFYGGNAIVAGGLPLAVGLALAAKMQGEDRITACFFGDGAVAEGEFHEAMNLAALWRLPVLFCCENNLYAMGTALEIAQARTDLAARAAAYGMPASAVDGMDVLAVEAATRRAVEAMRSGAGPHFLEFRTYRFRPHSMFDPELYRSKEEVAEWKKRDPIPMLERRMREAGMLDDAGMAELEQEVVDEVEAPVAFAEAGSWEALEDLTRFVYSETSGRTSEGPVEGEGAGALKAATVKTTYREAMREAIRDAMRRDERVFLMGEDVGRYGGCYAVSKGLLDEFGPERIRDTPLSESGFTGAGIGAALGGMRPIVEIMTVNFSFLALDQIVNNAATLLHMSGGAFNVPLVIRMATGGGRQLAAQHSRSLEGWYAHIPGLKVVTPATLEDARGMLWSALEDPDPVLIFEHVLLYNMEGELAADAGPVPLEGAVVRRSGTDVSLITYGGGLWKTLEAADELAAQGISAEVLDLRCLRPLDTDAILATVARTHRAVVVDEGWQTGGISAEVTACIMEGAFYELDAPTVRVCGVEVPMPYPEHLERAALPQVADIVAAVRALFPDPEGDGP